MLLVTLSLLASTAIPPTGAEARLGEALRERLPSDLREHALVSVRDLRLTPPCAGCAIEALSLPPGERPRGRVTARVRFAKGSKVRSGWIRAEVEVRVPALVLTRSAARGDALQSGDLELRPVAWSRGLARQPAELVGAELVRPLAAGEPVRARDVRRPTLVRRGDLVSVVSRGAGWEVRTNGEVLSAGALGERVRVRVLRGNKTVRGHVLGRGEVEVR